LASVDEAGGCCCSIFCSCTKDDVLTKLACVCVLCSSESSAKFCLQM
jgi:hypothetical protein